MPKLLFGNRSPEAVLSAPFKRAHYRSFFRTFAVVPSPLSHLRRYVLGGGEYPCACAVRTPLGRASLQLYSADDVTTVTEVFCREDYRCGDDVEVVVDLGSNIGVSGLYFLTRNARSRAYLFEPDPRNAARLRSNLAPFAERMHLTEAAVLAAPTAEGSVSFAAEPTGRYGRVVDAASAGEAITVKAVAIEQALRGVLAVEERIDVLKIDTEGGEAEMVAGLAPDLLRRIDLIYFETEAPAQPHADLFSHSREMYINRLARRGAIAA